MYLKYAFILFAGVLAVMLLIYKLNIQKQVRTEWTSSYVSVIVFAFLFYIVSAFLTAIIVSDITDSIIIILLGLSPFIIGRLASYERESFYSYVQIICCFVSMWYVVYRLL